MHGNLFLRLTPLLLLASACATAPRVVQDPPPVPSTQLGTPPPAAPLPPQAPTFQRVSIPRAPLGRWLTVDEVFAESFTLDSVPEQLPLDTDQVVVASVPAGTSPSLRAALLGGFLAAGFPVKDAGSLMTSSLQVRSEAEPRPGIQPAAALEASLTQGGEPAAEGSGLEAIELTLDDPTSLWVPDLLAGDNLDADYFLRTFVLEVEPLTLEVALSKDVDMDEVEAYRAQVDEANRLLRIRNQGVGRFAAEVEAYTQAHALYTGSYAKWHARASAERSDLAERYAREWSNWQQSQAAAIEVLRAKGEGDSTWDQPASLPAFEASRPMAPLVEFEVPEILPELDTYALDESLGRRVAEQVSCRRVRLLAELISAESGQVVWVGEVSGLTRDTVSAAELLRRAVSRLAGDAAGL